MFTRVLFKSKTLSKNVCGNAIDNQTEVQMVVDTRCTREILLSVFCMTLVSSFYRKKDNWNKVIIVPIVQLTITRFFVLSCDINPAQVHFAVSCCM